MVTRTETKRTAWTNQDHPWWQSLGRHEPSGSKDGPRTDLRRERPCPHLQEINEELIHVGTISEMLRQTARDAILSYLR